MDSVEDFMFRTMRRSRVVKAKAFKFKSLRHRLSLFEKSAELTARRGLPLKKSLCLSVAS
jgi:hypothetical protein